MIPSGNLYRVIVAAYLLQLYQDRSRPLGHVNCGSPFRHLFGHPLGHPLGHLLRHSLRHPLRHPLRHFLRHFLGHLIQA